MPRKKTKTATKTDKSTSVKKLTFTLSAQFEKDYVSASDQVQADVDRLLKQLSESGQFTPGKRPGKLIKDIWYLRGGGDTRVTFSYKPNNEIYFRKCGTHKILDEEKRNA